ncbi:MAG: hypothetical protein AAGC60_27115 [Acidobacteriota bacterium]
MSTSSTNAWLRWFSRLTWVGVAVNLGFILPALLSPDTLEAILGPGSTEFAIYWVPYAGMLLLIATLFYLPAAIDPLGRHVYAWLSVVGRGLAASFWLWQNARWDLSGPIRTFWITDGAFFVLFLVLLQLGMPPEWKISPANLARVFANWGDAFSRLFKPGDEPNHALRVFGIVGWLAAVGCVAFGAMALYAPQVLNASLGGVRDVWAYLWLGNCGLLLVQIALFMLPAASYAVRYRVYAWSTVALWFGSAAFWFALARRWSPDGPIGQFWVVDLVLAIVLCVALQRGMPEEYRIGGGGLARVVGSWLGCLRGLMTPVGALLAAVVVFALGFVGHGVYAHLIRAEPDTVFDDPEMQYKYGAIGLAIEARVPLYVWEVIPTLCGDSMPDPETGWASFGLIYEDGQEVPIGFAKRQIGYPSVEPTCSLCHTASWRETPSGAQQVAPGAPAHTLDLQAFQWFLYDCAASDAFTPKAVLAEIEKNHDLGWLERQIYRFAIIPSVQSGLALQAEGYAWQKTRPTQGRGRTDTFNPTKITVFRLPDDGTIGTVDLPATWNQRAREGMWLHWDGNNDAIRERNYAAAMAVGATPDSVVPSHFQLVTDYLLDLPPADYPFAIDEEMSQRGWQLFESHCADCHAFGSAKIGTVTDIAEVGTDSHRLESFTQELVDNFHTVHEGLFQFDAYRKTQGYANLPIDGIWARGPYLHNGSVPTLWDLLQPPENRPTSFHTGYDVIDPQKVGFVTAGAEAELAGFLYDTSVPGNSNLGHRYGTDLTDEEKWDLIEYLKTL